MIDHPPLHPISLRVTFEEKANLGKAAAGMSLSAYIRWKLFDPTTPPPLRWSRKTGQGVKLFPI